MEDPYRMLAVLEYEIIYLFSSSQLTCATPHLKLINFPACVNCRMLCSNEIISITIEKSSV